MEIFENRRDITSVMFVRRNWVKSVAYWASCALTLMTSFILFNWFTDLQKLLFDETGGFGEADHVVVSDGKGSLILPISSREGRARPGGRVKQISFVTLNGRNYAFSAKRRRFESVGKKFYRWVVGKGVSRDSVTLLEAEERADAGLVGANSLRNDKGASMIDFFLSSLQKPAITYQLVMAAILVLIGQRVYALALLVIVFLMLSLRWKEFKRKLQTTDAVCARDSRAKVYRRSGGALAVVDVAAEEIQLGDVIDLRESRGVACDVLLFRGTVLTDQAILTGESNAVMKEALTRDKIPASQNLILAGSAVLDAKGVALGLVVRIGKDTVRGELLAGAGDGFSDPFRFEQDVAKICTAMFLVLFGFGAFLSFREIHDGSFTLRNFVFRLVQIVLECFPPSLFFAFFATNRAVSARLDKEGIVAASPDKLARCGRVKVLGFDKTGTLTEPEVRLEAMLLPDGDVCELVPLDRLSGHRAFPRAALVMGFCHGLSLADGVTSGDPLEKELFARSGCRLANTEHRPLRAVTEADLALSRGDEEEDEFCAQISPPLGVGVNVKVLRDFPFDPARRRKQTLVESDGERVLLVKGAPESILPLCNAKTVPQDTAQQQAAFSKRGFRVLALAASRNNSTLDDGDAEFIGLALMSNALKPGAKQVVATLKEAGIRLLMVTGDNIFTAVHVGYCTGVLRDSRPLWMGRRAPDSSVEWSRLVSPESLPDEGALKHGEDMEPLSVASLRCADHSEVSAKTLVEEARAGAQIAIEGALFADLLAKNPEGCDDLVKAVKIIARAAPDQKKAIIGEHKRLMRAKDKTVAFVGDGANDCEALSEADLGFAIGGGCASLTAAFHADSDRLSHVETILIESKFALENCLQTMKMSLVGTFTNHFTFAALNMLGLNFGAFEFGVKLFFYLPTYVLMALTAPHPRLSYRLPAAGFFSNRLVLLMVTVQILLSLLLTAAVLGVVVFSELHKNVGDVMTLPAGAFANEFRFPAIKILTMFWFFRVVFLFWGFNRGLPFKQPMWTNLAFFLYTVFLAALALHPFVLPLVAPDALLAVYVRDFRLPLFPTDTLAPLLALFFVAGALILLAEKIGNATLLISESKPQKSAFLKKVTF